MMFGRRRAALLVGAAALAAVVLALALALSRSGPQATAQDEELGYAYSAKFLCGTISGGAGPLADGEYATAINVHNLQDFGVHIYKKAVLAPVEPDVGEPSEWKELDIPPDAAFEIDCPDILRILVHPCSADVDGSGYVDMTDVLLIMGALGTTNPTYDLDMDGIVDQDDVDLATAAMGTVCPPSVPLFLKGFVVIESPVELDVWGVYTSAQTLDGGTAGSGISEDIEVVSFTRQPLPVTCIDRDGDTSCRDPNNDPDDDGCTDAQEAALGSVFDPNAWYDVFDVPVPAQPDPTLNGPRNRYVDLGDVLAVLFYAYAEDNPNAKGVSYDSTKGMSSPHIDPPQSLVVGLMYDRSPGLGPDPVTGIDPVGPPNTVIDVADVLAALAQALQIDCTGGP